jgi:pSer/pThr/pTyr-binding forkhead associated (FHA) protein
MWKLVIKDEEGRQAVVPLKLDEYVLGRKKGNRVRLVERNVSREHAALKKKAGGTEESHTFILEDLTSDNGTFVNGARVTAPRPMSHGDVIQIGDYRIVLQDDSAGDVPTVAMAPAEPEYDPD